MTPVGATEFRPGGRSIRLWRALVSLSASPEKEAGDQSTTSVHVESLVVEFDEAYTNFFEGSDDLPSESQLIALQAVDTKVSAMVGAKDAALWTVRAFCEDSIWIEVRVLAEAAIEEFSWPRTSA